MTPEWIIEREGGRIEPGSGGRHRRVAEPSLVTLAVRQLWAQLQGALR